MKKQCLAAAIGFASVAYVFSACTNKLPAPSQGLDCSTTRITYNDHIQAILNAECNVSGCHDDNTMGRFGDYNTMDSFRRKDIFIRTNISMDMPPAGMSGAKVDSIACWRDGGFLEQ